MIINPSTRAVYLPFMVAELNRLNREIKKETVLLNCSSWKNKLADLNTADCSLYSLAKSLKRKRITIPPLKRTNDDELVYANGDKTEILAKVCSARSCLTCSLQKKHSFFCKCVKITILLQRYIIKLRVENSFSYFGLISERVYFGRQSSRNDVGGATHIALTYCLPDHRFLSKLLN